MDEHNGGMDDGRRYLANEAVGFYFVLCTNEAQVMTDGGDETLADVIPGKLGLFEKGDLDTFSGESSSGIRAGRTTANDENLGMLWSVSKGQGDNKTAYGRRDRSHGREWRETTEGSSEFIIKQNIHGNRKGRQPS
jgi:hypothetical protein